MTKKKETLRQAMSVSPAELRKLADRLQSELGDNLVNIGLTKKEVTKTVIENKKHLVPIINKEPDCSDTWEFEPD